MITNKLLVNFLLINITSNIIYVISYLDPNTSYKILSYIGN